MLDSFAYEATDLWQHSTGVKSLLNELGLPAGPCRLPLPPFSAEATARAREIIAALGVTK